MIQTPLHLLKETNSPCRKWANNIETGISKEIKKMHLGQLSKGIPLLKSSSGALVPNNAIKIHQLKLFDRKSI